MITDRELSMYSSQVVNLRQIRGQPAPAIQSAWSRAKSAWRSAVRIWRESREAQAKLRAEAGHTGFRED